MGVKTSITLDEINSIFKSYNFIDITPTSSGIIDTTYIAHTKKDSYILKKYERDISDKINRDVELLKKLKSAGLNVPTCIDENSGWYIYEKLSGTHPKNVNTLHIQELARFLAKLHKQTYKMRCDSTIIEENELSPLLRYTKENYFGYYKKFLSLQGCNSVNDGVIHGDIFKDNTVFDGKSIGVFDFIDSTLGSFCMDSAIALIGFDIKTYQEYFINLFLNTYNQKAPKKLDKKELISSMKNAANLYALKRVHKYKNTSKAQELIRWI